MAIVAADVGKALGEPPTRILSGLDAASQGAIEIDGRDVSRMTAEERCRFRNTQVGFVFQFHYLPAEFTAIENVLLPARAHSPTCLAARSPITGTRNHRPW